MKKSIFAVLIVSWMIFIFSMSSQTSEVSSNTSGETIKVVLSIIPKFSEQPEEVKENMVEDLQFITRKSAHFIGYMILGILSMLLFLQYDEVNKKPQFAFLISAIYAICDEIHQLFVPGRAGQVRDVLIDSSGSLVGILIVLLFIKLLKMKKTKIKRLKYNGKARI